MFWNTVIGLVVIAAVSYAFYKYYYVPNKEKKASKKKTKSGGKTTPGTKVK